MVSCLLLSVIDACAAWWDLQKLMMLDAMWHQCSCCPLLSFIDARAAWGICRCSCGLGGFADAQATCYCLSTMLMQPGAVCYQCSSYLVGSAIT
ncbi:hypothetical protein CEXT_180201 [Caerostris extrusa]|uniref:Secreted protein n=1 Tax=Caerostris extrusa TaxID=172846 RepID=A0AAV4Q7V1_CAEEX|nr:hypothetical protein CEXT_180201 [Caerostris extrusa]